MQKERAKAKTYGKSRKEKDQERQEVSQMQRLP